MAKVSNIVLRIIKINLSHTIRIHSSYEKLHELAGSFENKFSEIKIK
ncbi:MAG: hypothetical protein ABDH21_01305 [bacterium]